MSNRPLSKRASFRTAIVLAAEVSEMSGLGEHEIALKAGNGGWELWQWAKGLGPAERITDDVLSSWREAAEVLAISEDVARPISPTNIKTSEDPRYVPQILALAWSAREDYRNAACLMLHFSDAVLASFGSTSDGTFDAGLLDAVTRALGLLGDASICLEEIPDSFEIDEPTPRGIGAAIDKLLMERRLADEKEERESQHRKERLRPWLSQLADLERRWRIKNPSRRYPGGGTLPPMGLRQVMSYTEDYVLAQGLFPTGVHIIQGVNNPLGGELTVLHADFSLAVILKAEDTLSEVDREK